MFSICMSLKRNIDNFINKKITHEKSVDAGQKGNNFEFESKCITKKLGLK